MSELNQNTQPIQQSQPTNPLETTPDTSSNSVSAEPSEAPEINPNLEIEESTKSSVQTEQISKEDVASEDNPVTNQAGEVFTYISSQDRYLGVDSAPTKRTLYRGSVTYSIGTDQTKLTGEIEIDIRPNPNRDHGIAVIKIRDANGKYLRRFDGKPWIRGMRFYPDTGVFSTISDWDRWDDCAIDGCLNDPDGKRTSGAFWDYTPGDQNPENELAGAWDFRID